MSDLERKLLGRLTTPEEISDVWNEGVRGELFEEPLNQAVYNFTIEYWQQSKLQSAPTAWVLEKEYPGYTASESVEEETLYLASLLRRRYTTNQLQMMMRTATETMHEDPIGTLKLLHSAAFAASESVIPQITRTNMAETVQRRRDEYAYVEQFPQGMGAPYGLDLLDLHTGGLLPGELAVVGGFAKTGKSMLGLNVVSQQIRQGYKPIIFSLEMSLKECEKRLDAMFSGVSYNRLIHGQLTIPEMKKLYEAQDELASLGGIQIERPDGGDRTVGYLVSRACEYGANYMFIDQLSHMEPPHRTRDLKEHHGTIIKQLKNEISRAGAEIPCLLAAQLRRGDEEITMESFANAAEIEREVDIALGLWRNSDMRTNHRMRIDILGSRRGDNANFLLDWELTEATRIAVYEEVHG